MIGYWATLEHAATWAGDQAVLGAVRDYDGRLTACTTQRIAGTYRVARSFRGVGTLGYNPIAEFINDVDISEGLSIVDRVDGALGAVHAIAANGYSSNPSGVSKLLWFRRPDHWYMYDRRAARAVGAGQSSVSGMRGFFGILHAADVATLNEQIGEMVAAGGLELRSERIIDKFLWLLGADNPEQPIARLKAKEPTLLQEHPRLEALAKAVEQLLPNDRFDLIKRAIR